MHLSLVLFDCQNHTENQGLLKLHEVYCILLGGTTATDIEKSSPTGNQILRPQTFCVTQVFPYKI